MYVSHEELMQRHQGRRIKSYLFPVLLQAGVEYLVTVQANLSLENQTSRRSQEYRSRNYFRCICEIPSHCSYLVPTKFSGLSIVRKIQRYTD